MSYYLLKVGDVGGGEGAVESIWAFGNSTYHDILCSIEPLRLVYCVYMCHVRIVSAHVNVGISNVRRTMTSPVNTEETGKKLG